IFVTGFIPSPTFSRGYKMRLDFTPPNGRQWAFFRGYFCLMFYPLEEIFAKKTPIIEVIFFTGMPFFEKILSQENSINKITKRTQTNLREKES
ncbi:MAG: hypothetical protein WCH85_05690, partial [Methanomicrobiales archaeon]